MNATRIITIVTRQSPLALWQAHYVRNQLQHYYPQLNVNILGRTTQGDALPQTTLNSIGSKNLFVKELQQALLQKEADIAVHSLKDLSVKHTPDLMLAAYCKRADARDVLLSQHAGGLSALVNHAIIGTASPRRQCQLNALVPQLKIKSIRGNVGTRLRKLIAGDYDAIVLAAAGLKRLGLAHKMSHYLNPNTFIPAIGQGAIGVECRTDDSITLKLLSVLDDPTTRLCVSAERAVNRRLGGDCFTPLAAHAILHGDQIHLNAMVGSLDGQRIIRCYQHGPSDSPEQLGLRVGEYLLAQGAQQLLDCKQQQ